MLQQDEVVVGNGRAQATSATRPWLTAPLAVALALLATIACLLGFAGAALGATRAPSNALTVPLDRVAQPFDGAPPAVEAIEPAVGSTAGGTDVTITGSGFTSGAKVKIGSEATEVKVESETEITAKTAAHVTGTVEVVVTAEGASSTEGPDFTYVSPPKVSGITPAEGSTAGGTTVKIKGTGFREGSKVKIGGTEAKSVAVVSETEITARTSAHAAGKEEVVVTDGYGTSTGGPSFTYVKPPTVTEVEPSSGTTAGGASVTIKGTGFLKAATVTIGSAATSVVVVSETEITAKTAAHAAGAVPVVVSESGVSSGSSVEYTYKTPPTVTSIAPAEGSTAGGTTVKIKGTGFLSGAKVKVGTAEATEVTVVGETEITAKTPSGSAGKAEVVVSDSKGVSAGTTSFTYIKPPTVTKVEPAEGTTLGGTSVKIKGTGFLKGATVTIGAAATSVVVVSETEITAKTAAHAAAEVPVEVSEGGVSQTATVEYTYVTPPTVTKVEPSNGPTAGGTEIVLTGTGFTSGAKVKIGTVEATEVKVESETEITAKTAAASAGKDEVIVTDSKGVSAGTTSFTYIGPPAVTSVTPAEGSTAGGTAVKVKGTGFGASSKVKVGGTEATETKVVSETEITAKTPAGSAGKAEVVVTDADGSSTSGPSFTYIKPPTVTKVEPAEGTTLGGTAVTIKGTGFLKGATVTIGSAATSVVVVSETEITAKTAAHAAGAVPVDVTEGGVSQSATAEYTYVTPPAVTSITPAEGSTAGGTAVKIKGTGFVSGAKVKVGTTEATEVTVVGETEITAKTPAGSAGKAEVVVSDSKGVSAGTTSFTYIKPPTVTKVEPAEGTTLGGTSVKIKGTGFLKGATVTIGSAATSVVVVSETEITAKTAAHAAAEVPVEVSEGGVSQTATVEYTYVTPPTVTKVEPSTGPTAGGTEIVLTGTGFTSGAKVKIGTVEATEVKVESETEITAKTAAASAGKDEVIVTDSKGVSSSGASFTYIAPPKVSGITPAEGSTAGATVVKVKGTGFGASSKVKIGSEATEVKVVSETEITAKTAATSAGKSEVVVTDADGASTGGPSFTYITPPTVTEVEPSSGTTAGGASVTIKGTGFLKAATVTIGSAATSVVVVSETEITAKTAAHAAGAAPVVVTEGGVSSGSSVEYTYKTPPTVTSITPAEGSTAGGTAVKIKGTGFLSGAKVKVGTAEATEVTVVGETEITAKTPAGSAGKAEVVVSDSKGVSSGTTSFTYIKPPTVTKVEPAEGTTLGGTSVKIKGTGFLKGATVTVGSAATSVVVVSETEITAKTAAHAAAEVPVEVTEGGVSQTATVEYTYVTPPTVTKVEPSNGPTAGGTEIVLTGTGFTSGAKVKIGTVEATEVKVESETEITAKTAAASAGKDEVIVTDSKGVSSSGASFIYIGPPAVTSITPAEGSTAGGTAVKIKGTGFGASSKVKIGSEATEVKVVSETEITAKTAATSAGKDEVVVTDADGASTSGPSFTYIKPPTVTKVEPAEGTTLGGTAVTIKGTGFLKAATVTIGSVPTSVVVVSETEITAKTAAHVAGATPVVVTEGGVSSGSSVEYTYVTPPSVTSIAPAEGSTAGGTAVKIKGTGFVSGAKVKVGTTEATEVTVVGETEITAKTPAGSAGKAEVVVTDSKGVSAGTTSFTYIKPPTVTKVEPAEGTTLGGTSVKIKGTGFLKGATVTIGSAATSVVVVSETEITAKTAAHAAAEVPVEVTEGGVSQTATVEYTYVTPPTVTKVEPSTGPTAGGTEIVLTGTGFTSGAKVKIGTVEATEVKVESETEITAKTAAASAGKDEVIVTDSKGVSAGTTSFTYIAPPKVTGITPAEGSTAGGTAVKIKGTGFGASSKVKIGSEATEVKVVSETEITAKTAATSAGKAEVVVTDADGASTGGPSFTYITPPTVTKVEPAEGTTLGGTSVTITGTGFLKGATVTIGSAATSVVVVSETEITAKTAAHAAGAVPVDVTEGGVSQSANVEYTYVTPPSVTSITPAEGSTAGGTAVKIKGTGFVSGAKVKVGTAEATEVTVVGETEITAKTPAGSAGKAEVVVTDSKGVSAGTTSFTYIKPPTVTKVEPAEGTTLGGTSVKIKGTGFLKGATVTIGSAATSVVVVSETEITAKTAAHAAAEVPVDVTEGGVSQSATVEYTYVTPPTVTKVEPSTGSTAGGTEIVLTGAGFTSGAKVKIGTVEATEVKVESETEITAKTAAASAGKDEIIVTDSKGVSSGGASFTYIAPPKVSSITPAEGSTAGGTVVKIKGTGFLEGSKVKFGSTEASEAKIVSETEMTAKAPAGSAGKAEVVVTDADGASTGGPSFTYIKPPTVTKVEPAEGTTLGGTSVTIKGTGFLKGATVTIGSAATSVVVVSETEITAKTAAHAAGAVPVDVTEGGVSQSANVEYTYVTPPSITKVEPSSGPPTGGREIVITGTGFTEGAKVKLGASEATEVTVVSETEITAKTPAGSAGKVEVTVTDSKGTSNGGSYTYT